MQNNIKVFMSTPDRQTTQEDGACEMEIGENIVTVTGSAQLVCDISAGFSNLFAMDANTDVSSTWDFVGEIKREKDGRLPSAEVRLERLLGEKKMYSVAFIRIGNKGLKLACEHWEDAEQVAKALVEVLGLKAADKKGRRFTGPINIEEDTITYH